MLLEFKVGNFLSFKDVQTLRLAPVLESSGNGTTFGDPTDMMFIYGANGSGKSNLVKAAKFARDLVLHGSSDLKAGGCYPESPSYFEFVISLDETVYSYGFEIYLDKMLLESEWLYVLDEDEDKSLFNIDYNALLYVDSSDRELWPIRCKIVHSASKCDSNGDSYRYRPILMSISNESQTSNTLSIKAECVTAAKAIINWFKQSLYVEESRVRDEMLPVSSNIIEFLSDNLQRFDTGIANVKEIPFEKEEIPINLIKRTKNKQLMERYADLLLIVNGNRTKRSWIIHIHNQHPNSPTFTEIRFIHEQGHESTIENESLGTLRIIQILALFSSAQINEEMGLSKTVVIDEIECSVHTVIVCELIRLFKQLGLKDCQLISTTHRVKILNSPHIDSNCVSFIEIDRAEENGSRLYTLRSFNKSMNDLPVTIKKSRKGYLEEYMDGRMGAVPVFTHPRSGEDRC